MLDDILGARDEIDQMLDALPRTSRQVQDKIKVVEESMSQLNSVVMPYTDLAAKLKARDDRLLGAINQLKQQNQTLSTKNDSLSKDLNRATEVNEDLTATVASLRKEKGDLQAKVHYMTNERALTDKNLTDAEQMIDKLRESERTLDAKNAQLQVNYRTSQARVGELENLIETERREHTLLIDQNDRVATNRMQDQKSELDRRHQKQLEDERKDHAERVKEIRANFAKALTEDKRQIDMLDAKWRQYYAKYDQLAKEMQMRENQFKADCQRRMVTKFTEFVTEINRENANARQNGNPLIIVPRMENIAARFQDENASSSPSDSGRNARHDENNPPGASRKRASSRGPTPVSREDVRMVAGNVFHTRSNPPGAPRR